jgi:hypothetical protein
VSFAGTKALPESMALKAASTERLQAEEKAGDFRGNRRRALDAIDAET